MSAECTSARSWLSAFRDSEAPPDAAARRHIDDCSTCTAWEATLDTVTRRVAVRAAGSPDVTTPALAAWAQRVEQPTFQHRAAQVILTVAGVAGLVLAGATALGLVGSSAAHPVRDLVAMESAMAIGFLVGAWRPDRYTRGLLPVAAVAGVLTVTGSTTAVGGSSADLVREAAHLPVLLGVLGLFVAVDAVNGTARRRR